MFDVAPTELLLIGAVAIAVIPPKDLPRAMRFAGQWIGKARGIARHFRSGVDEMIRQAELDEIEKKWREENERIMREHPLHDAIEHPDAPAMTALPAPVDAEQDAAGPAEGARAATGMEIDGRRAQFGEDVPPSADDGPELPLGLPPRS